MRDGENGKMEERLNIHGFVGLHVRPHAQTSLSSTGYDPIAVTCHHFLRYQESRCSEFLKFHLLVCANLNF